MREKTIVHRIYSLLGRLRRRWESRIKFDEMEWNRSVQDMDYWWVLPKW
jgi:hypothetical protein